MIARICVMRILIVSRYKSFYANHQLPFVTEQGVAIAKVLREAESQESKAERGELSAVEFFLLEGNYWQQWKALKRKIKEWKPDIIHAHYGLTAVLAELQSQVPVVTTFHNGETWHWYVNFLTSLMSMRAKHVIYVAQHIHDLLYFKAKNCTIQPCGVPKEKMVITPYSEARKQLGWSENIKYIVFGGAFDDLRKNYPLLRQAVERLEISKTSAANREWTKIEGGEMCEGVACIELYGLTREECVLRMCAADLFALPSHSEGSPQALKEAMALNCPCIATDIADVRVLFGDEPGHWILRNPKNTPERWDADEKSLDELVALLKEALEYGKRTHGRDQIEKLGLFNEQIATRILKIYEQVLENKA